MVKAPLDDLENVVRSLTMSLRGHQGRLPCPPFRIGSSIDDGCNEALLAIQHLREQAGRNKNVTDLQYSLERIEQMCVALASASRR